MSGPTYIGRLPEARQPRWIKEQVDGVWGWLGYNHQTEPTASEDQLPRELRLADLKCDRCGRLAEASRVEVVAVSGTISVRFLLCEDCTHAMRLCPNVWAARDARQEVTPAID